MSLKKLAIMAAIAATVDNIQLPEVNSKPRNKKPNKERENKNKAQAKARRINRK